MVASEPSGSHAASHLSLPGRLSRDYSFAESWAAEAAPTSGSGGEPTLVSVWLALTDCTLDNGCMVVLPKGAPSLEVLPLRGRTASFSSHLRAAAPASLQS